jgi:BirA family transcriptional regulator, biotin operon repressor / biotin---[acetyl-CoA-carboxylase] ligase
MDTFFAEDKLFHLDITDSTNSYANRRIAEDNIAEGSIFWAEHQEAGKGQRNASWISAPGENLTFSIILKPAFLLLREQFYLNRIASLACHKTITSILARHNKKAVVRIKWPNDILINEKKAGGILIENLVGGEKINCAIIGIGLNINQKKFPEFERPATSLSLAAGVDLDRKEILEQVVKELEFWYLKLHNRKHVEIHNKYDELLYQAGDFYDYDVNGSLRQGKVTGTTRDGKLKVDFKLEKEVLFDLKEIKFLT